MVLLVDAGNSRLKWSELGAAGNPSAQQALAYGDRPALASVIDLLDAYPTVGHITLVHVLTQLFADSVQEACDQRGIQLHSVRSVARAYGITNGYQNPAALGADRFVGLVAAHHQANGFASIVIDCGTAITVDAVESDGRHLGGLILPGLQLSADALIARAQGRLSLSFEHPGIFADSTDRAIGSGCLFGIVGAIEGICARMQHRMSAPLVRVLTGGDAEHLRPWLQGDYQVQPDLLMHGLSYITEQAACTSC
jgi:type III pantothenate kinase